MSIQIAEISQRLQSALDQNYNVADMETVLQVITQLERIQITKEELETTRLGKHINHLRRKTANESLARRAKNLLKRWREMVWSSGGAPQQQQQQPQQTIPRDSPAVQYGGAGTHQQFYNQNREAAQFPDADDRISADSSRLPSSDSRRYGRMHDTGSNHAPSVASKGLALADQTEDCNRYNKFHDIKSNLSANVGRQPSSSSFSGKSKEPDPYRSLPNVNDNTKISISALPKIPKIKNSTSSLRLSKHTERSHSPLVNLKESSSPKFASIAQDDNSMHAYDIQNYKRFPPNQPSMLNGRNSDNNSTAMDNNSNSSSINIIEPEIIVPNVGQPSSEIVNSEVVKKKHKKHKKDKKSKKQKQSASSASVDRHAAAGDGGVGVGGSGVPILELPDSLSSNSMSLFATTSDSFKDHHASTNNNAFANSIATSLPSTSLNQSAKSALWTANPKLNTVSTDDLTFTGKFTKTDDNIINIDSSSGSNSPKYHRSRSPMLIPVHPSRSSSPSKLNLLPMRGANFGSRVATDEENSSNQHISMLQQTESSLASAYGESLVQDDAAKTASHVQGIASSNVLEPQQTGKKRGRKKGSKGVDSRLGSASNSSQSQQAGAPYYDSISFSSLKNKIDLIRGTTKKVKTTKELLEELQNRKATTSMDDISGVDSQLQSPLTTYQDGDENGFTNGKHIPGSRTTSPMLSSHTRPATSERSSSKKSKLAAKDGSMSDNQSSHENQMPIDSAEPKSQIDKEIEELQAKLPPVNRAALIAWQKQNDRDAVVCTCKLIEIDETENLHDATCKIDATDNSIIKDVNVPKMLADCNVLPTAMSIDNAPHELHKEHTPFSKPIQVANLNSTVATSTSISIPSIKSACEPPEPMDPPVKKPTVKSIFDLDYEEDDPITFKLNHNNNINLNTKLNKLSSDRDSNNDISDDKSCDELFLNENIKREGDGNVEASSINRSVSINSMAKSNFLMDSGQLDGGDTNDRKPSDGLRSNALNSAIDVNANANANTNANAILSNTTNNEPKAVNAPNELDPNAMAFQSRFRVEEDPECKAKQLYITSKQLITEFHIEKLHTSYIPNINGNWDDAKGDTNPADEKTTVDSSEKPSEMVCDDVDPAHESSIEPSTTSETTTQIKHEADAAEAKAEAAIDEEEVIEIEMEPRITEASIGLYERVVPLCNHLVMDRLPKNLSHINLNFGPSDEVEPDVFIASITVKKEVIPEREPSPSPLVNEAAKTNAQPNENSSDLVADDTFERRMDQDFRIYGCDHDIECERKSSPDIAMSLERGCETMPTEFECEPVEQLSEMEVDDIVINDDDDLKTDEKENDLYPIANDPFVETIEPTTDDFIEVSDIGAYVGNDKSKLSPVIDENARADAHDVDNLHQVIDLNPNQILPTSDENAMDSMDFENQLSKSFDVTIVNEAKIANDRSDVKSNDGSDAELEPDTIVGSIPTSDLSESDDAENDNENDGNDSSLEEDLSFDNYEQEDTSNDHFITLDNFDAALVPSEFKQSPSNNSGSSCDEEANKASALEGKLFGNMVCDDDDDDDNEIMSDSDDTDGDSETSNNLLVPTMFCKPVFIEGGKSSNLLNDNSDSQSAANSDDLLEKNAPKDLEAESSDSDSNPFTTDNDAKLETDLTKFHQDIKLTKDALETHEALSSLNEISNQQKRFRSSSSSSISSTSSTTSSSSSPTTPRSKKMKRWMRRRPCPQHYRRVSSSSQSSSHSPMSALSPSTLFINSNAVEPNDPTRMDAMESAVAEEFPLISNPVEQINAEFDDGHIQTAVIEPNQEPEKMNEDVPHEEQIATKDVILPSTSPLTEFVPNELVESNASLTGKHDDDLLFHHSLPEQLFQSDEKDGDGDSNSVNGVQTEISRQQDQSLEPADAENSHNKNKEETEPEFELAAENNGMLPSFNELGVDNVTGVSMNGYKFKEWYEVVHVKSYNDELLTILPYVVID